MEAVDLSPLPEFTILIVDDEELVREVNSILIEENGGKVLLANDGEEGLTVFSENKSEIDVVLLDFSMPRRNGYELYLEIKKLKPEVPVIMASGLGVIPEVQNLVSAGELQFISKPYHEAQLMSAIKQALVKK